jgi:hypothetical protein
LISDAALVAMTLMISESNLGIPTCVPALAPARSSARGLVFALPEEDVVSAREDGDDARDTRAPEPAIRRPP